MATHLNSVKTKSYHHGALRAALLDAAGSLLEERGVEGFSLRETARRAGVSPAAPAHHFGDSRGLLTALATEAFHALADRLEEEMDKPSRAARITGQGVAYVRFALTERARFDLMWRAAILDTADAAYRKATERAFGALDRAVRGVRAVPVGPDGDFPPASIACWSIVHGFARLAMDGAFGTDAETPERAAQALLLPVLSHLHV